MMSEGSRYVGARSAVRESRDFPEAEQVKIRSDQREVQYLGGCARKRSAGSLCSHGKRRAAKAISCVKGASWNVAVARQPSR